MEVYERKTTGIGPNFCYRQRRRLNYLECRFEVAVGSLLTHCQRQHGVGQGGWGGAPPPPPLRRPKLNGSLFQNVCFSSGAR